MSPFPPSPYRSMRGCTLCAVAVRMSQCWAYRYSGDSNPAPQAPLPASTMFCPLQDSARLLSAGRGRIHPGMVTILFLCEQRKRIKKKNFLRKTPFSYSSSVLQLAAWMALSVSRSSRDRASAFLRYAGTETALQIRISDRVARRVRLLAEVRKFW